MSEKNRPDISALQDKLDSVLGKGRVRAAAEIPADGPSRKPAAPVLGAEHADGVLQKVVTYPAQYLHGTVTVGEFAQLELCDAARVLPETLEGVAQLDHVAFLDTETTGLMMPGQSPVAFMIGVGRWRGGSTFEVTRFFMEDRASEGAMLDAVSDALADIQCLVTYNGKTFDLPLLKMRYEERGLPFLPGELPHLDLLQPARKLWKHLGGDCKLQTLERELLGFTRVGDIPGAEIPGVYHSYLRRGADERLSTVFEHNALDILSLAGFLWAVAKARDNHWEGGRAGLGLLHAKGGRFEEALSELSAAARDELEPELQRRVLRELVRVAKKCGDWPNVVEACVKLRRLEGDGDPYPFVEAAKALENKLKEPQAALEWVEEALTCCPRHPADRAGLEKRRDRLLRKIKS